MPVDDVERYKNRLEQVTSLNTTLFQYPPILSTIIGGLWYFAAEKLDSQPLLAVGVFAFAALVGLFGAMLIHRTGAYLAARLGEMTTLEGGRASALPGISTATIMVLLMVAATALSVAGVILAACRCLHPTAAH